MHVPDAVVQAAVQAGNLTYLGVTRSAEKLSTVEVLHRLSEGLETQEGTNTPIRICIPSLGSPSWGSLTAKVIRSLFATAINY